jgi:hypothetical protein
MATAAILWHGQSWDSGHRAAACARSADERIGGVVDEKAASAVGNPCLPPQANTRNCGTSKVVDIAVTGMGGREADLAGS